MNRIPVRQINSLNFSDHFTIRDIKVLLSEGDIVQEIHRHNFFFVLALEKGMGEHVIDFTSYSITDYSVFFMRPGQVHHLALKKGSTGYLMEFNADFYKPSDPSATLVLQKVSNKNFCQVTSDRFKRMYSVLAYIFQEYTDKQEHFKEVIRANLEIFFIELVRQSSNPGSILNRKNSYSQERFEELLSLLETHITTHKQVAQYADKLHLTTYQLNAIIKETVGKTCSQLINEHIILEAKRQLLATSNQVNQIAFYLGFEDPSYFIRFFKKHTAYTPDAFRIGFK